MAMRVDFIVQWPGTLAVLVLAAGSVFALDPNTPTSEFLRTDFTVENGLPSNVVNAIVQTRNGYLWIGTDAGLASFNGKRFTPIYFRAERPAPQGIVRSLLEGPDGALWVGTGAGLARIARPALDFFDRSLVVLFHPGIGQADEIICLRLGNNGALWVGTNNGLYQFRNGTFLLVLPGLMVNRMEETADGHLLIITPHEFIEWDGQHIVQDSSLFTLLGHPGTEFLHVFPDRRGTTWFCTSAGLARREGNQFERFSGYGVHNHVWERAEQAYEDPQGTMWVRFRSGVSRVSTMTPQVLLKGTAREIYSDRDGDLWVGTNGAGLIRFTDRLIRMFTQKQGLPSNIPMALLPRSDGTLWVGNNCGGIAVLDHKERFHVYAEKDGLSNSCVWALAEDTKKNVWVGTFGGGLYRFADHHFTQFSRAQGLPGDVVRDIHVAPDDSLWMAVDGGLSHLSNGHFHNYTTADGLSSNHVLAVHQDRFGSIWAGTGRGVDHMIGEHFVPIPTSRKIFDPRFMSFAEDPAGALYVMNAPKGVDRIESNRLINVDENLDLFSMSARGSDRWFSSGNGVFRFDAKTLTATNPEHERPLDYTSFGFADGLNSTQCSVGNPNITITKDGKLWVATVKGLAQVDLGALRRVTQRPAIFVTEITIGRTRQIAGPELVLSPGTHHTELHFDSVSLKSPEKIRFQYRMDDIDPVWLDADPSLTAVYTNIPLGTHSFHLRACNADGIWDPVGITYRVTQRPYVYETMWFRFVILLVSVLLLIGAYRLRLRRIAHQYNLRLDERVYERTRIARELHDTLLQSFQGLMLRFQSVQNMLPDQPVKAKESLAIAINRAAKAIVESRDAVTELRSSRLASNDLVQALSSLGQELSAYQPRAPGQPTASFRVLVEGALQDLQASLRDDLYRVAREAVGNAFRHSQAGQIEIDIRYDPKVLRLRIRDDGVGIHADILTRGGRDGHWGLRGMKERASSIGGKLEVWTEPGQGTEIEVVIPAAIAYRKSGE